MNASREIDDATLARRSAAGDERFPEHVRIVINGVTYVHWYDCLSHLACGIDPRSWRE